LVHKRSQFLVCAENTINAKRRHAILGPKNVEKRDHFCASCVHDSRGELKFADLKLQNKATNSRLLRLADGQRVCHQPASWTGRYRRPASTGKP
jgi:hypothetical protein